MLSLEDITVEVRDRTLVRRGQIGPEFLDLKATRRHCNIGDWKLRLPQEHPMVSELLIPGSGILIALRGNMFMSGSMVETSLDVSADKPGGIVTFAGVDDNVILADGRAWPEPSNSDVASQTLSHDVRAGNAETVMRGFVADNIGPSAPLARRGLFAQQLTMATNLNRGLSVTKSARFPRLLELLQEIATYSRLGFRVVQVGNVLQFQVSEIQDRTAFIRFDIENGSLQSESVKTGVPGVTRVIVAGQEQQELRQFLLRTTTESVAAEAVWGRKIEEFLDQRQTSALAELQQAGDKKLTESGFTATVVKAVPADQDTREYGIDWDLGDDVTVNVQGQEPTTTVTEVALIASSAGMGIGVALGDVSGFKAASSIHKEVKAATQRVEALERAAEDNTIPAHTHLSAQITDLDSILDLLVPPGVIWEYGGSTAPSGFVIADGQAYNITDLPALFAIYGYTYGGNGTTTFGIPDKRRRVGVGRGDATNLGGPSISIASPAVITKAAHGLAHGQRVFFTTTGALPTGIVAGQLYYVKNPTSTTFNLSSTLNGAPINTSGSQSGTHTLWSADFHELGQTGGETTHSQSLGELVNHNHPFAEGTQSFGMNYGGNAAGTVTFLVSVAAVNTGSYQGPYSPQAAGGSLPMMNLQLYQVFNYIIKT